MIERGVVLRGFIALFVIALVLSGAYLTLSDTDGTSGNFLEDGDNRYAYGPIFEEPNAWRSRTAADRFVRDMRLTGGETFSKLIVRQVRIDIDGTGPIPERAVTLQTAPAVQLFDGPRRDRATEVLHGMQRILEDRGGLVEGISFARTRGGVEAAAISGIVEEYPTTGFTSKADQAIIRYVLRDIATSLASGTYAWYDNRFQQIVFGPEISKGVLRWIEAPDTTTPAQNLFTAYVVRHELEHAVTPRGDSHGKLDWMEEATADVIARWPGAAAETASELGMTYPKRFDKLAYETDRGGYPAYVKTMRVLVAATGIDPTDPKQLDDVYELLQERELRDVPREIAARIAKRNQLTTAQRNAIERGISRLDGTSVAAARRAVATP